LPAAAGLEMLKAAAEVFDDIEDADNAESWPLNMVSLWP